MGESSIRMSAYTRKGRMLYMDGILTALRNAL